MISKADITKLAKLARLTVTDDELSSLTKDLERIVEYISDLSKLEIPSHTEGAYTLTNVMREDGTPHASGIYTDKLLAEAPDQENGYLKVKNIF